MSKAFIRELVNKSRCPNCHREIGIITGWNKNGKYVACLVVHQKNGYLCDGTYKQVLVPSSIFQGVQP